MNDSVGCKAETWASVMPNAEAISWSEACSWGHCITVPYCPGRPRHCAHCVTHIAHGIVEEKACRVSGYNYDYVHVRLHSFALLLKSNAGYAHEKKKRFYVTPSCAVQARVMLCMMRSTCVHQLMMMQQNLNGMSSASATAPPSCRCALYHQSQSHQPRVASLCVPACIHPVLCSCSKRAI